MALLDWLPSAPALDAVVIPVSTDCEPDEGLDVGGTVGATVAVKRSLEASSIVDVSAADRLLPDPALEPTVVSTTAVVGEVALVPE